MTEQTNQAPIVVKYTEQISKEAKEIIERSPAGAGLDAMTEENPTVKEALRQLPKIEYPR
jgi:hypothetical protein